MAVTVVLPDSVPPTPVAIDTVTWVVLSVVAGLPKRSRIINLGTVVSAGSVGSIDPDSPPTAESSITSSAGLACAKVMELEAAELIEVALGPLPNTAVTVIV